MKNIPKKTTMNPEAKATIGKATDEIASLIKHMSEKKTLKCEECQDKLEQIQQALLTLSV